MILSLVSSSLRPIGARAALRITQLCLITAALPACSNLAPPANESSIWTQQSQQLAKLTNWQLRGRVNVRYDNESQTPRIQWQHKNRAYQVRLWGTFNAGNTFIRGEPGSVTLDQGDEHLTASSPEELILQKLGYELPISFLEFWIKGLPAPDSPAKLVFNELNQLTEFKQAGWIVVLSDLRDYDGLVLPRRVDVRRSEDETRLRFFGLSWTLQEDRERPID